MKSLTRNETGAALITAILVLMLVSGLTLGMFAALTSNSRSQASDRDQSVAYAAAHAGLEKLTAGLAALFLTDFSPSAAQISVVDSTPPTIAGFTYTAPGGGTNSGYDISFTPDPGPGANTGNPLAEPNLDITTGPFEGFKGLITPYVLTVTARSTTGNSEVRLRRELQTVAVPVFQFGIFGEKSLGFHAGPQFDFGGRVHTNESLFLAGQNTLIFRDKLTAVLQVVRDKLSNGRDNSASGTNHPGDVMIPRVIGGAYPGSYRNLTRSESSGRVTGPCIALATTDSNCYTQWQTLSSNTYAANIRTEATGARRLNLPLTSNGATPIDLIKRPLVNENTTNPALYGQRYFAQASLRILLSDRATDITTLPGVTADAPLQLDAVGGPAGYVVAAGRPAVAVSPGPEGLLDAADGLSLTRIRDFPSSGQLRFRTAPSTGGSWNDSDVPAWLRWSQLDVAGVPFTCNSFTPPATLAGCTHPAFANNTVVNITPGDGGPVFTGTLNGASPSNNNITFSAAFTATRKLAFTRGFFVGEDVVVCTGITTDSPTRLSGCTSPNGTTSTGLAANDPVYTGATTTRNTPLLNGFIKIEQQRNPVGGVPVWADVTLELLNLGFAGANQQGDQCDDPTPNAVIRLMRLRDNGYTTNLCDDGTTGVADYGGSQDGLDYWPNLLFDAREGWSRELTGTNANQMHMGGLFSYTAFDGSNFKRWLAGTIGTTGNLTLNQNGYIIYFSDRRGDHDETAADAETGEYGHEDSINPAAEIWAKTNALETGENFNESRVDPTDLTSAETLQTYGETPHPLAVPAGAVANMQFDANQRPWTAVPLLYSGRGRMARPVLFRRALKIINSGIVGGVNQLPTSGISITAENPIYLEGNFNADETSVTLEPNVPAAVMGDSITLLSRAFRDSSTFQFPNSATNRNALTTGYRFAMVTGKTIPFPKPSGWGVQELGSDGGVHNFMKMLEDWGSQTLRYRGSMVSLYYSRQAIGIYRADSNIYSPPTRGYNFDSDFLSPPLLPPGTPMFRDINTLKFRQILRPNQ